MVSIDMSLFIQIINFIFLIWVLNMILFRPIRNILLQRKEKIANLEQGIDSFHKEAVEKQEAFTSGLKDARVKGLKEKETLLQAAADEEKAIVGKINEKAAAELAKIREKIAKDAEEVKKSLLKEIDTFANEIGKKILGRVI